MKYSEELCRLKIGPITGSCGTPNVQGEIEDLNKLTSIGEVR